MTLTKAHLAKTAQALQRAGRAALLSLTCLALVLQSTVSPALAQSLPSFGGGSQTTEQGTGQGGFGNLLGDGLGALGVAPSAPDATPEGSGSSGSDATTTVMPNTNLFGFEYRSVPAPADVAACQQACIDDAQCLAWTHIAAGIMGPEAMCSLKDQVPAESENSCCVSGVKEETTGAIESDPSAPSAEASAAGRFSRDLAVLASELRTGHAPNPEERDAIASALDNDPERLAAWVRDAVRLVPYSGSLKGAQGALVEGAANGLDRALVLGDLLQRAGYGVTLGRTRIAEREAEQLFARSNAAAPDPQNAIPSRLGLIGSLAENADGDSFLRRMANTALLATPSDVASGMIAVGAPLDRAETAAQLRQRQIETLREHWVVLARIGDVERVVAVDADLLPDMPARRFERVAFLDVVDGRQHAQNVTMEVVIERLTAGEVVQETLLSHEFTPADMRATSIHLGLEPLGLEPGALAGLSDTGANAFLTRLALDVVVFPTLSIDGHQTIGRGVDASGQVFSPTDREALRTPQFGMNSGIKSLGRQLRAITDGSATSDVAPNTWLAASLRFHYPGLNGEKRTAERPLFDVRVPAHGDTRPARSAEAAATALWSDALTPEKMRLVGMLQSVHIGLHTYRLPLTAYSDVLSRHFAAVAELLPQIDAGQTLRDSEMRRLGLFSANLLNYRMSRFTAEDGLETFLATPQIVLDRRSFAWRGREGQDPEGRRSDLAVFEHLDIVAADVDVRWSDAVLPVRARIEQGVADAMAETLALTAVAPRAEVTTSLPTTAHDLVTVTRLADLGALSGISPAARHHMSKDIAQGNVLFLPPVAHDKRVRWWRVDPKTGSTVAMLDTGTGATFLERLVMNAVVGAVISGVLCEAFEAWAVSDARDRCGFSPTGSHSQDAHARCLWEAFVGGVLSAGVFVAGVAALRIVGLVGKGLLAAQAMGGRFWAGARALAGRSATSGVASGGSSAVGTAATEATGAATARAARDRAAVHAAQNIYDELRKKALEALRSFAARDPGSPAAGRFLDQAERAFAASREAFEELTALQASYRAIYGTSAGSAAATETAAAAATTRLRDEVAMATGAGLFGTAGNTYLNSPAREVSERVTDDGYRLLRDYCDRPRTGVHDKPGDQ
ncbi:MAG: PAN domain-containing protein [Pseudomonadota bacterium]